MLHFGWTWEDDFLATKLLGIHIADEIVPGRMTTQLRVKLERGLQQLRINPRSLIGRATAINNLILSSLWFAIALWVGSDEDLWAFEKEITRFLWFGQGRGKWYCVAKFIIYLLKQEGGLGVLSIQQQRRALVGKFILWAMRPRLHPLQCILWASIQWLSLKKWGLEGYSWVFLPCHMLLAKGSNIWMSLCKLWNCIKKSITPATLTNHQEIQRVPIWTPHTRHISRIGLSCRTSVQQWLLHEGISKSRHVTSTDGDILHWQHRAVSDMLAAWQRSYTKLVSNLSPISLSDKPDAKRQLVFVASLPLYDDCSVW